MNSAVLQCKHPLWLLLLHLIFISKLSIAQMDNNSVNFSRREVSIKARCAAKSKFINYGI